MKIGLLLLLLLMAVSACTTSNIVAKEVSSCDTKTDLVSRDQCYLNQASSEKDQSLCSKIYNSELKAQCYDAAK